MGWQGVKLEGVNGADTHNTQQVRALTTENSPTTVTLYVGNPNHKDVGRRPTSALIVVVSLMLDASWFCFGGRKGDEGDADEQHHNKSVN